MQRHVTYRDKFYRLLHPRLVVVLATKCPNNRLNLMPASWNTPVSEDPPTVAVAIDRESYTHSCLQYHKYATINILSIDAVDLIYNLGSVSGAEVDKVSKYSVELAPSEKVDVPRVSSAIAGYEVEVYREVEVGEVVLYIFKVLNSWADRDLVGLYGYDLRKTNLPLHGAGRRFYKIDPASVEAGRKFKSS
ncbi:MAG: flavin reductase family protein [Pyrobaculum sp.]